MNNSLRQRVNERGRGSNLNSGVNSPFNFNEMDDKELGDTLKQVPARYGIGGYGEKREKNPMSQIPKNNSEVRTGMSQTAWNWVFSATEVVLDVIKGVMIVGGIIASNLADFIMGSIGISLIVNTNINSLTFVNGFGFGSILSLGSSSIQIYMWSLIQKRGITAKTLLNPRMWRNIPHDVRGFLWTALFLWVIDTILDVSPTFVLFTPENFTSMMWLYYLLVTSVVIIVTILCGFAEILTSNMRAMLAGSK